MNEKRNSIGTIKKEDQTENAQEMKSSIGIEKQCPVNPVIEIGYYQYD